MKLSGNTVLITGGTSGIGYALAEAMLRAGNTVAVCARTGDRLQTVKRKYPELHVHRCDVARESDRQDLIRWVGAELPQLNVLVNNAGVQRDIDFTHGIADFLHGENEIRINLEAPIRLSAMLIPTLAKNPASAIINVSSGLAFVPAAKMPVYSASKAGMHAYCLALREQLARIGIKVFEIVPPAVQTGLNPEGRAKRRNSRITLRPETFVTAVIKALKGDIPEIGYGMTSSFIHASRADLDNFFHHMNNGA